MRYARETMGQAKSEVFAHLLGDLKEASAAMEAFDASVGEAIESGLVTALPGATEAIAALRSKGLGICLTTGFSSRLQERLLGHLGWRDLVDFWLAPAAGLRGRPFPDMVLVAALRTKVDDVRQVAVAGDTASDLWSGWRAGAGIVAGVLTGSHSRQDLEAAPHTHIIPSIADFPALVG
jgi:phosphoglycolate phosphatase